jgi:hypothetical protein
MKNFENIQVFAELIPEHIKSYMNAFPKESQAAESVHQGIATLVFNHLIIDLDDVGYSTAATLSFGAHAAWINSFNMSVAGYIDTGWSEIRRAVEFICYASKVIDSKERAIAWVKQRTDKDARRTFSRTCQIPTAYTSNKYEYLRELLVTYDIANYYGAHANLETLGGKYRYTDEQGLLFSYQADKELVCRVAPMMILNGYRILQALRVIFDKKLRDPKEFDELMKYIDKTIIDLRIELANNAYNNSIPDHIIQYIVKDNRDETNKMFEELLDREKARKEK